MEQELLQSKGLLEYHPKTSFAILSKGRVVSIRINEITHVSKCGNETVIYTATLSSCAPNLSVVSEGGTCYKTFHSLQEIMNDLPVNDFCRIHKSHIVSLRCINEVKKKRIQVGEYYLPVSTYYKVQLCSSLAMLLDRHFYFISSHE